MTHLSDHYSQLLPGMFAAIVMVGAQPAIAEGTLQGQIEVGVGAVDEASAKFGEYNGLDRDDEHAVLNADLSGTNDSGYWRATASDLGLDSRALQLDYRRDDGHRVRLSYREIEHILSRDGGVPYFGVGSSRLTLPAGWVAATTTAGMTNLQASLRDYEESTKRKRLQLDYGWHGNDAWSAEITYRHETKEGLKTEGGVIGNTGGNPRAVTLPVPVDYVEQSAAITLNWQRGRRNVSIGYDISHFDNEDKAIRWQNPYAAITGWNAAAGYPTGEGQLSQDPDNLYQRIFATYSAWLGSHTSAVVDASYALFEQDEDFLPYSVNPALSVTTPLPRQSAEAEVALSKMRATFNSRITPRWRLRTKLAFEQRDDDTPREHFIYIGGDSQDQASAGSSRDRVNRHFGYRDRLLQVNSDYRMRGRRSLGGEIQVRKRSRDIEEVDASIENNIELTYRDNSRGSMPFRVSVSREQRRARGYHLPEPGEPHFENIPTLRRYYLADRDRHKFAVRTGWQARHDLNAGLNVAYMQDDYRKTEFGLAEATYLSAALDITRTASELIDWNVFLGYETYESEQKGRNFRGGGALATQIVDPDRNWAVDAQDTIKSAGLVLNWRDLLPRVDGKLDYRYSRGTGEHDFDQGSALTSSSLADLETRQQSVALRFDYHVDTRNKARLKLVHAAYDANDFHFDSVAADTLSRVIAGGQQSPEYDVNWASLSWIFHLD